MSALGTSSYVITSTITVLIQVTDLHSKIFLKIHRFHKASMKYAIKLSHNIIPTISHTDNVTYLPNTNNTRLSSL